jgi:N-glycosylase/DNA lyase
MKNEALSRVTEHYSKNKEKFKSRLEEFKQIKPEDYFYELVFCILTPQSQAKKCWQAVLELKQGNLDLEACLRNKTRFHNNKAKYIRELEKKWPEIKGKIESLETVELRNWLSENVKGLGLKEASHFLRNIGKSDNQIAILDRHILRNLVELKVISKEQRESLNKKTYLELEQVMKQFAESINIPLDKLDLLFWSKETGEIFK